MQLILYNCWIYKHVIFQKISLLNIVKSGRLELRKKVFFKTLRKRNSMVALNWERLSSFLSSLAGLTLQFPITPFNICLRVFPSV